MMIRTPTLTLQSVMTHAITTTQQQFAQSEAEVSSGLKVQSFADLGAGAATTLSAGALAAREDAYAAAANAATPTLNLYQSTLSDMTTSANGLRQALLSAVGSGSAAGLQATIDSTFGAFRSAINTTVAGVAIYGGGNTGQPPFSPTQLANLAGTDATTVFHNDQSVASVAVGTGVSVATGQLASAVGGDIYQAFRTLAEAGPIGDTPTATQQQALQQAAALLNSGLGQLRTADAANGQAQNAISNAATRASDRATTYRAIVSSGEDADLATVAATLAQQQTQLQASYAVFAQISRLSLANYLN